MDSPIKLRFLAHWAIIILFKNTWRKPLQGSALHQITYDTTSRQFKQDFWALIRNTVQAVWKILNAGLRKFIFLKVVVSACVENIQTIQWPNFLRPLYPFDARNKTTASCRVMCDPFFILHVTNAKRQCSESVRIQLWSDSRIRCGYYLYAGLRIRIRIRSGLTNPYSEPDRIQEGKNVRQK